MDTALPPVLDPVIIVSSLRDNLWLIVGALVALCVGALGAGDAAATFLRSIVPLPWGSIGLAVVVFAAFAGLHFRLQLVSEMERRRDLIERQGAASRLIHAASADGRRWLRVVQENLEMVEDDTQADRERKLYLSGARANADKLEQAFERIEGNQRRLDGPDDPAPE